MPDAGWWADFWGFPSHQEQLAHCAQKAMAHRENKDYSLVFPLLGAQQGSVQGTS